MARVEMDQKVLSSLMVMGSVVEARDAYTGGHLWRVAQFSALLAEKVGLDSWDVFLARIGGFLHDLGKVGVPDAILNKAGPLSEEEYAVIKTHPGIGGALLAEHPLGEIVEDAVVAHHERPDGKGYPFGLGGDQVPMVARIVGIADAFDAMTSSRPYRKGMATGSAIEILGQERGRQFDDALTAAFLSIAGGNRVGHIVGHSFEGARLADCPVCGPIIPTHGTMDGHKHACRACGGLLRLNHHGGGWEVEVLAKALPDQLAPRPDFAPIRAILESAPA